MILLSDSLDLRSSQTEASGAVAGEDTQSKYESPNLEIVDGDALDSENLNYVHDLIEEYNRARLRRFPNWERSGWVPDVLDRQSWRA